MSVQSPAFAGKPTLATQTFYPLHAIRCAGPLLFRHQLARDVACLLDVDDTVSEWTCQSQSFSHKGCSHQPDFVVERSGGITVIDVITSETPRWVSDIATLAGFRYETVSRDDLPVIRLKNAKDLLRYSRFQVSLDDRVRLLAVLDENGNLTVAECLSVFRETRPIPGLASMVLNRFVEIDLDETLIGPESTVRRRRG